MKRFFCFFFSIVSAFTASAQMRQDVISSAGGSKVNINVSLSWTLGETIIPMFRSANNNITLSSSFLQSVTVTAMREPMDISVEVTVFPNPATEEINIRFESPVEGRIRLSLIDSQGRLVNTGVIEQGESEKNINLKDMTQGVYYLRLYKGEIVNVYKLVKTQ